MGSKKKSTTGRAINGCKIKWKEIGPLPHGSRQWQSTDGLFKLQCIDRYDGIPMKKEWVLYQWRGGSWSRVDEGPGRNRLVKLAQSRADQLENDDD